jgi:NlpC/P60 family putative phage cell wall peptidase
MRRDAIAAAARGWIGTPYRHQASLRGVGCDCLGLLRGVWRDLLGDEPETPPAYGRDPAGLGRETLLDAAGRHLVRREDGGFEPGDVLVFRWRDGLPASHCAIVSEPGAMIHAHEGAAVAEVAIAPWWDRHLAAVFSFPGAES